MLTFTAVTDQTSPLIVDACQPPFLWRWTTAYFCFRFAATNPHIVDWRNVCTAQNWRLNTTIYSLTIFMDWLSREEYNFTGSYFSYWILLSLVAKHVFNKPYTLTSHVSWLVVITSAKQLKYLLFTCRVCIFILGNVIWNH